MSVPFIILAAIFFLLFLVWVILSIITIYHVVRYANWTRMPLVIVFVYLCISAGIIVATGFALRDVDWNSRIDIETPSVTNSLQDSANDLLP